MIKIISVDFQKDFSAEGGVCYRSRPSVNFIKNILSPFLKSRRIKIAEIVSDYRQPRPGDRGDCCHPGEWGYESEIPWEVKDKNVWVKCMNSPIWIRKNVGVADKKPGLPYQDPEKFEKWLHSVVGKPEKIKTVVLIGLTLDCCLLCTAQELNFRGYDVKILSEGTDPYSGDQKEKEYLLKDSPITNWADSLTFEELKKVL